MNSVVSVASLASAAAIASPSLLTQIPHDPIFEAIERHRVAASAYRLTSPDHDPEADRLAEIVDRDTLVDLLTTRPTTLAGFAAVLRYVGKYCNEEEASLFHESVDPWNSLGAAYLPMIAAALETLVRQHAGVLGPLAAAPSLPDPDTDLRSLRAEMRVASRRLAKASIAEDEALDGMKREAKLLPPLPDGPQPPAEHAEIWKTITSAEFERLPSDHPLVVWEKESEGERSRIRQMKSERAARLGKSSGYDEAHEKWENILHNELWPLAERIWRTPAHTAEGALFKFEAAALVGISEDECKERWARSVIKDLRRMAKAERAWQPCRG